MLLGRLRHDDSIPHYFYPFFTQFHPKTRYFRHEHSSESLFHLVKPGVLTLLQVFVDFSDYSDL